MLDQQAPIGEPALARALREWMLNETYQERFIDNIFVELCERLNLAAVPVARATLHFRINNPQWLGARIEWLPGLREARITTFEYGTEQSPVFLSSPMFELTAGAEEVRQNLLVDNPARPYPLFEELRNEGLTDYVAWPLQHTLQKRHVVTFATAESDGFSDHDIAVLRGLVPILALVSEVRIKNALARTLLQTYVGPHASEEILAGATTRGSGVTLSAAVLIFDIRGFTAITNAWPRDDVIELLNAYFDAIAEPIDRNGGEILKFMGDGLLAVFPLEKKDALANTFQAVLEARFALSSLNDRNTALGRPSVECGVGVHVGDVMYGNIGSKRRLDFTVIGPAVNIASRLESLTKTVHHPVLFSEDFVSMAHIEQFVENLGAYELRGVDEPMKVFALR
ncbi:adenylate/guanylate cyclase domain-containing protein [Rhizobium glycinendophyticum]|uniref:Adenylate/guanylate cyclase domain-containing protein n=1 Tax=Rhizobium glycinendophyticum TaxID=2589807 RepID=A0A504URE7_9HYPH|nr:adenylate/guanylate cyclase domain-containing protein [Rhizobium glycinendophyticum]TPP09311.1 adenylate/guanylate cyclase domain-containing protein [Rhizobium glycinendophyticum]